MPEKRVTVTHSTEEGEATTVSDEPAIAYLEIALDSAKRGQWDAAAANAIEGGKYCGVAGKLDRLKPPTPEPEEGS